MYTPAHFLEADPEKLAALVNDNAFAAFVTVVDGAATASHIPFVYDRDRNLLLGHVARANPQWESVSDAQDVLTIFQGPHAYVSPTWYKSPGVPTWNYAAVHIHGTATAFDERDRLAELLTRLSGQYEASNEPPWSGDYDPRMLEKIVGIEVRVDTIEGKFKLNQNRPAKDRRSVISKLKVERPSEAARLAELMENNEQ